MMRVTHPEPAYGNSSRCHSTTSCGFGMAASVKGSRTPAARAVPDTGAAGVREASGEMLWDLAARMLHPSALRLTMECPVHKLNDLSRSLAPLEADSTLVCVIELSLTSWLIAGVVPGVERQPLKKVEIDERALLKLLHR